MFRLIKLIKFRTDATQTQRARLADVLLETTRSLPQFLDCRVLPSLGGSHSSADLVWHVDSVAFHQQSIGLREPGIRNGVYRVLFVARLPGIESGTIAQYEAEQREMARYIPQIRNWGLSQVAEGSGARRWDYVWEQEFQDYAEWKRAYMAHPYHWARIHRWFDPESPQFIHDPWYALSVAAFGTSLMAQG
jgi:hypothetical protein